MNNNKNDRWLLTTFLLMVSLPISLNAAVSEQEALRLSKDLTPIGAEKAGNKEGTIPAWTGGIKEAEVPKAFKPGMHYINPFPDDKPLFVIDKSNLDKHRDKLSAGQIALFEAYPETFKMPIYKTRRTARQPERVYYNTRAAATKAQLLDGGNGFKGAYDAYPFPIPKMVWRRSGITLSVIAESMWSEGHRKLLCREAGPTRW